MLPLDAAYGYYVCMQTAFGFRQIVLPLMIGSVYFNIYKIKIHNWERNTSEVGLYLRKSGNNA